MLRDLVDFGKLPSKSLYERLILQILLELSLDEKVCYFIPST